MGPLKGLKVVELAGQGPVPFGCMLLADMGADVILVDRVVAEDKGFNTTDPARRISNRGRRALGVDLKSAEGLGVVRRLVAKADVLVEGFRPGVAERIGLGPADCEALNSRLIYARMTGWGQDGPLAQAAGHDLNYIALTGALHGVGSRGGPPVPPLNYAGDFGGGSLYLALGILAALVERASSGRGQLVDAAVVDGTASLMTSIFTQMANGIWRDERGSNLSDGGRPWYSVYETADGKYVSIAPLEPKFYAEFLRRTGLSEEDLPRQYDANGWDRIRQRLTELFLTRTRDEWCALLEGHDACFAPVLTPGEAAVHPHNRARGTFVDRGGILQPAPAPRLSRTPSELGDPPPRPGQHNREILSEAGYSTAEIDALVAASVVG